MAKPTVDTTAYGGRATIHFNPGKHYYTVSVPGLNRFKVYQPGVTTILGLKDKSGPLQWWTAEQCEAYGMKALDDLEKTIQAAPEYSERPFKLEVVSREFMTSTLQEMKRHYRDVKKQAAEVGSLAHDYLHAFLMWREFGGTKPLRPGDKRYLLDKDDTTYSKEQFDQANSAIDAGLKFYTEHEVKPLTLEKPVWSPTFGFIGTDDFIGRIDGEKVVADYKTSKRIYPEVWLQTAAYQLAYQEENPKEKIKARVAINIGKEDGRLEFLRRPNEDFFEEDRDGFLSLLGAYQWDRVHGYEPKDRIEIVGALPAGKVRAARAGR